MNGYMKLRQIKESKIFCDQRDTKWKWKELDLNWAAMTEWPKHEARSQGPRSSQGQNYVDFRVWRRDLQKTLEIDNQFCNQYKTTVISFWDMANFQTMMMRRTWRAIPDCLRVWCLGDNGEESRSKQTIIHHQLETAIHWWWQLGYVTCDLL